MTLDLTPFAICIGGMSAMLMVWLLVQRLWARVFVAEDCDVLKLRAGCDACGHEGHCPQPSKRRSARATDPAADDEGGPRTLHS